MRQFCDGRAQKTQKSVVPWEILEEANAVKCVSFNDVLYWFSNLYSLLLICTSSYFSITCFVNWPLIQKSLNNIMWPKKFRNSLEPHSSHPVFENYASMNTVVLWAWPTWVLHNFIKYSWGKCQFFQFRSGWCLFTTWLQ